MSKLICPRCKQRTLDPRNNGDSSIYGSDHVICVPCFHDEELQQEEAGTNDLPTTLATYGPSNRAQVERELW